MLKEETEEELLEQIIAAFTREDVVFKTMDEETKTKAIQEALDNLHPRLRKILILRFGFDCEEHTLEQLAGIFCVTKERIRQLEAKAFRKLRQHSRAFDQHLETLRD
jgi:RNA polymerase primary sigma factor